MLELKSAVRALDRVYRTAISGETEAAGKQEGDDKASARPKIQNDPAY